MRALASACVLVCAGAALAAPADAQTPTATGNTSAAPAVPASAAKGNGASSAIKSNGNGNGASYVDALIDDGNLEPDIWMGEVPARNADGWPRGLRLDGIYSNQKHGPFEETQYGVGIGAFLSTPDFGAFSFEGVFGHTEEGWLATLWQRDMPFDDGWRATNGFGNLNSPGIDYTRFQPRWFIPSSPLLGASTEWRSVGGTQLVAGIGEPGAFTGLYVPGFRKLGGYVTTVGSQFQVNRNLGAGLQYMTANNVTSAFQIETLATEFSTRTWFGATSWQDATQRYQLNVLQSDNNFTDTHMGAWADGMVQAGRYTHGFGAFWLGSNLAWGNQSLGSDSRGAYYRINYASRQWLWDLHVDYADPIGAQSTFGETTFYSGSLRHQLWQGLAYGGGGNVRMTTGTDAWSGFVFVENTTPLLINRTQLYAARNTPQKETTLSASQTWTVPAGTRLSTTVQAGRYENGPLTSSIYGLAVMGGGDLAPNLSIDANVQWLRSTGDAQPTTLLGNVSLTWRILTDLQLLATAYRSQTRSDYGLLVTSPIDDLALQREDRIDDRGVMLILRYETRAGTMAAPLGGTTGGGAGRVVGYVFLDGNEDGRMAAGDLGAANVTVILNGRWSTRTDAQGRFEFPAVVSGHHTITVMPDNLPLPWQLTNDGRTEFDVPVRGTINVDIPAQRMR